MRPIDADALDSKIYNDIPLKVFGNVKRMAAMREIVESMPTIRFGRWEKDDTPGMLSPGGTPLYVCAHCGGSGHLYGGEYPRRKIFCDSCDSINFYPWEKFVEEGVVSDA